MALRQSAALVLLGVGPSVAFRPTFSRRALVLGVITAPTAAQSRTPGSTDLQEALQQIRDGRAALRDLQRDWKTYACIDDEGRACNIDVARKILGGVAPQRGDAAIEVAKKTPLYRIDGAFTAVRKAALVADEDSWVRKLDLETFVDKAEEIVFALKKTDDSFYSVVFASKGSSMLEKIYGEAKQSVDRALDDMSQILALMEQAGAPNVN